MKIGILTVPFNNNYGGFLQAYALKTVLQRRGHEVVFINRKRPIPMDILNRCKRVVKSLLGITGQAGKQTQKISVYTNQFVERYLSPISKPCYTTKELQRCVRKLNFEGYVVGSDQVWRYAYAKSSITDFFLGFLPENDKSLKIAYAASFGVDTDEYPEDERSRCTELLKSFDAVSVREHSALSLMASSFGRTPVRALEVLDPTMLLKREDYEKMIDESSSAETTDEYIWSYVLDESPMVCAIRNELVSQYNVPVITTKAQTVEVNKLQPLKPVEQWLREIRNARFVFTDSFHGTVFSIIFHKPFYVCLNEHRGVTRFQNLLANFGLQHAIASSVNDIRKGVVYDWNFVDKRMQELKKYSLDFLISNRL